MTLGVVKLTSLNSPKYGKLGTNFQLEVVGKSLISLFEDNKYDVIIEPAGLYWLEMAQHWPKTKFIQLVRDIESWETSASNFLKAIMPASIPHGAILNQVLYENEHISPTAHHALHKGLEPYPQYIVRDHEISSYEF